MSGGIVERSRESGVRDLDEEPDDVVGQLSADMITGVEKWVMYNKG